MTDPATPDAGTIRPRSTLSLQRRVGRSMLLLVALAVLVTGLGGYLATWLSVYRTVDATLVSVSDAATRGMGSSPDEAGIRQYVSTNSQLGFVVTEVLATDGTVFTPPGSKAMPVDRHDLAVASGTGEARVKSVVAGGDLYRVRVVPIGEHPGFALVVGRPMAGPQQVLGALALSLVAFGVLAVIAAGVITRRVARAGIAPVRELTGEIEERAAADDLRHVDVRRDDELGRLGVAFNHLLDTIKVSRIRQARFVADAGHELRTPLTSMRTNIELLSADATHDLLPPDDRLTIMRDVRAQLIEFSELVSDLIGLTREDRNMAELVEVDLTAVLEETVDRVSMRGTGIGWQVDLEQAYLVGDGDLLSRAFANVLDNALKFSPPGGTVSVTLAGGEVRIWDQGRGVDLAERPFVFDRFFRSEASRATPGTGLGLSITESVVRQHGGTVMVTEAPGGGALFAVRFPGATRWSRQDAGRSGPERAAAPSASGRTEV